MAVEYHVRMRDLPADLMPRERMMRTGPGALNDAELLALILRTGTSAENVVEMCTRVYAGVGGWKGLAGLSIEELSKLQGIGPAKACQIQALVEISRRMSTAVSGDNYVIRCPQDVVDLVMEEMRALDKEHFKLISLNTKNRVLGIIPVSVGSLNSSPVHPREVFKEAIKRSSAAIILLHNHPSGDPTPSKEDIEVTKRLAEAGRLLGIDVYDHVIIGDRRFVSLKEKGIL